MANQVRPFARTIRRYFFAYGGWRAVFGSPFFVTALAMSAISYSLWLDQKWPSTAQSLLPNLLGFSLGTYSIVFSLITSRVKRAMRSALNQRGVSRLEEVNATFFHFIFVQVIALVWAFIYSGTAATDLVRSIAPYCSFASSFLKISRIMGSFIGYVLLLYSFLLIIGAAQAVYRLALIVDPQQD